MFSGSSPFSDYVDTTFLAITGISLLVLLGLLIAMVYFVVRYSRKKNPHPTNIEGHVALEITWTVVPLVLFMGMFYMGWQDYLAELKVPENAVPVKVTAQMWKWTFEYENGKTTDSLYVPVNKPIKLILHSNDVNHSFFVPAFRLKKDVFPNRERIAWFIAEKTGRYNIACAEYCGLHHSYMYSRIIVMSENEFKNWMYGISDEDQKLLDEMTKSK